MIGTRSLSSKIGAGAARTGVLLLLLAAPSLLRAQEGTVAGTIVSQDNQRPLPGVEVGVVGTTPRGTVTDASGRFRLTGLTGTTVVLNIRVLGFRPVTDTVQVGTTDLRIQMSERVIELNSVVVTGIEFAEACKEYPGSDRAGIDHGPSTGGGRHLGDGPGGGGLPDPRARRGLVLALGNAAHLRRRRAHQ